MSKFFDAAKTEFERRDKIFKQVPEFAHIAIPHQVYVLEGMITMADRLGCDVSELMDIDSMGNSFISEWRKEYEPEN